MRYASLVLGTALLLAACAVGPGATPSTPSLSTSPSSSPTRAPATLTPVPTPSEVASPQSSPTPAGLAGGQFATVLVNGLAVRQQPGTAAPLVRCEPETEVRLDAGDVVLVLPDPPAVDETSTWHRVVAPSDDGLPQIGTACDDVPFVVGWIATGSRGPWVAAAADCPGLPTDVGELAAARAEPLRPLACFESQAITVRGSLVPPPEGGIGLSCPGIEPGWLTCGIDQITDGTSMIPIRIPPGTSLPVDSSIELEVRFDHSAAQGCVSLAEERYSSDAVTAFCRSQLVVVP